MPSTLTAFPRGLLPNSVHRGRRYELTQRRELRRYTTEDVPPDPRAA